MKQQTLQALQQRWETSLPTLRSSERERLVAVVPQMRSVIDALQRRQQAAAASGDKIVAQISPKRV